jgi:hypothetical protein
MDGVEDIKIALLDLGQFECRLKGSIEGCIKRQIGNWRFSRSGKLNRMFASCLHPSCKFWLSDDVWEANQGDRKQQPWERKIGANSGENKEKRSCAAAVI